MLDIPANSITFLFTDIEGSTQLWEQHPEAMKVALARHDRILRQAIESHHGHVFKTVGDAFYAAFPSAPDAVSSALDAQRVIQAESWGETPIKVRMALHTGAADERDGDYFGPALNRVARLLSAGHGGQTLLSAATEESVRNQLPKDTELHDMGERRLKDLTRPEHIYQLLVPGLPANFLPLKTLDTFHTNLPAQLTSFIGREKEMAAIKQLVLTNRLTTLTGPGGTGKTRLSLQVASNLLDSFPDGVWFIELAPLTDPVLIPQTVLGILGLREDAGRLPLDLLSNYLQSKRALLIFDNCEHLIEASAHLTESLLQACPQLHIITSSREALGIAGETPFRVPSLSIPDTHQITSAEKLAQSEAVRLFIDRAKTALPAFTLTDANAPAVAQICARLDGIPLAIELAAARVKLLKVEQVAERLDDRFRLLTGGSRTALPRQQTLRAMIDWSYDLLSESEQVLLRRLSVFAGGWTLEAAEEVCSIKDEDGRTLAPHASAGVKDEGRSKEGVLHPSSFILHPLIGPFDVLDLLDQLVNKSLVVVDADIVPEGYEDTEARYHLLETVRQYAREKLMEAGEGISTRDRHLNYFMRLAERAEPEFTGPHQVAWMKQLDTELDNLRAALEWSLEQDVLAGLRLASALKWFWVTYDRFRDGSEKLAQLLTKPQALVRTPERAKALAAQSLLLPYMGNFTQARMWGQESISIYDELGDRLGLADGLLALASCAGNFDHARSLIAQGLEHYQALGDKPGLARALGMQGEFSDPADYLQARRYLEQSLAICRELGHIAGIGANLINLGTSANRQGEYALARVWLEEALEVNRAFGRVRMAETLMAVAELSFRDGKYDQARTCLEEVLSIMNENGQAFSDPWAITRMGYIALRLNDPARAGKLFKESLKRFKNAGSTIGIAYTLEGYASLAVLQNQLEQASRLFAWSDVARANVSNIRPPTEQADVDHDLATIRTRLDEAAFAAAQAAGRAMSIDEAIADALESASS
jgi:predicted ATPase/class 3 adenylate cyclase